MIAGNSNAWANRAFRLGLPLAAALLLSSCAGQGNQALGEYLVKNQAEYREAVEGIKPGQTITLANGTWNDFEILFVGQGEKDKPIRLMAETKGEVDDELRARGKETLSIFLPTTPNPTSGFLLFVPKEDVIILKIGVEDAAKLVISAGLVVPDEHQEKLQQLADEANAE